MSYVNIQTKKIVEVQDILNEFYYVSFPDGQWTDEMLKDFGYAELHFPYVVTPSKYEKLTEQTPVYNSESGRWERSFVVESIVPTDIEQLAEFIENEKQSLKNEVTTIRYNFEVSGITDSNGNFIKTDRESQAKILEACRYGEIHPEIEFDWKTGDSKWVKLTVADVNEIARLVGKRIQELFTIERMHHENIDKLSTIEEIQAYNTRINWG